MLKHVRAVAVALGLLGTVPAAANPAQECTEGQDFDRQIAACSFLAQAAGNERDRSTALYNRGLAYDRHGSLEQAKASYDAALRMDPTLAAAYIARGRVFEQEGEADQALAHYDEAVRLEPSAVAVLHRARILELKAAFQAVIDDLERVLQSDPELVPAHDGLGRAFGAMGELAKALAAFDRALTLDPEYAPSHYNRAIVLEALGDRAGAAAALANALRRSPQLGRSLPKELTALLRQRAPPRAGAARTR